MWLQRFLLWERRNNTVMPFKETVQQVWARISALRDSLDGPQAGPTTRAIFLVHAHRRPAGLALHLGTKQVSGQPPRYEVFLHSVHSDAHVYQTDALQGKRAAILATHLSPAQLPELAPGNSHLSLCHNCSIL